jgi:hypothetical protein
MTSDSRSAPAFEAWLDGFFASYYRRRPVNATFIGIHYDDHLLPDLSLDGLAETRDEMRELLDRLHRLPVEDLTPAQEIDRRLAEGFLEIGHWEYDSPHFARSNPSVYTSEAIFGVISLFLRPFARFEQRAEDARARLEAIPTLLAGARAVVKRAPEAWIERAARECTGALALCGRGVDILLASQSRDYSSLRQAADRAARAFTEFQVWLKRGLEPADEDGCACGSEAFDLLLRRGHFLTVGASEIEREAEAQISEIDAYLREHAADFGAGSPAGALARLADIHPPLERYYSCYTETWQAARRFAAERHLLTWPDYPIDYHPQPEWARGAAPYLYFLFYRSPAPFDYPLPVDYLVTPIEESLTHSEQNERLRAVNQSVIKLNHVIHHGGIGHHVQNWHAFRAASRIARVAAVDCAARIAFFAGGTMAEGWACYATELMDEHGFLTPLESYAEKHARLRMAARALADVRLHDGRWTLGDAAGFYRDRVGMTPAVARAEAVKNSMFPATALMYLTGTDLIHGLRKTISRQEGSAFDLRRFHDRFLSFGSMPVPLTADAMEQGQPAA